MNIFILDYDIEKCVQYHNNKHCIKMILEQAQLLCSAHWMNDNPAPYKLTHKNHPCSIWTRESIENYNWLCEMSLALSKEYTHRYNKIHKTEEIINWCIKNKPKLTSKGLTKFALAVPDKYKTNCAVESYRNYYLGEKIEICQWKNREIPFWFLNKI